MQAPTTLDFLQTTRNLLLQLQAALLARGLTVTIPLSTEHVGKTRITLDLQLGEEIDNTMYPKDEDTLGTFRMRDATISFIIDVDRLRENEDGDDTAALLKLAEYEAQVRHAINGDRTSLLNATNSYYKINYLRELAPQYAYLEGDKGQKADQMVLNFNMKYVVLDEAYPDLYPDA